MRNFILRLFLSFVLLFCLTEGFSQVTYDVVVSGGRVIDPETQLDAIRNVAINGAQIVAISQEPLVGKKVIDATGLVVSPGFIDLHVHGMTNVEQEYQMHDGVTTALDLESGQPFLKQWLELRKGNALINYGACASWGTARIIAMPKYDMSKKLDGLSSSEELRAAFNSIPGTVYEELSSEEIQVMLTYLDKDIEQGALGIALPIGYYPGAQPEEDYRIYQHAAELQVPVFSHVREGGLIAVQQAIANAMLTHAPLHIVHMNSMALKDIALGIEMVQKAQQDGFDITTEMYPYTAASTNLASALFDIGWQEAFGISYEDLQWVATGERLTKNTFEKYRAQGGTVIIHMMKPEWITTGLKTEGTIVASDGMPYAKLAHPRTAGTFSRVLGKYVREDNVLTLKNAIEKMTLLPARRMELSAPSMRFKGRIQIGADADITIFDPETIIDKATFEKGLAFSKGVEFVIVNGITVLENGQTVDNVLPGAPVIGKYKR